MRNRYRVATVVFVLLAATFIKTGSFVVSAEPRSTEKSQVQLNQLALGEPLIQRFRKSS